MIRPLVLTPTFSRDVRRMTRRNRMAAVSIADALALLENDAFDSRLGTHKLQGRLASSWSCSAGYDLRLLFEFEASDAGETIVLHSCGKHDDVY